MVTMEGIACLSVVLRATLGSGFGVSFIAPTTRRWVTSFVIFMRAALVCLPPYISVNLRCQGTRSHSANRRSDLNADIPRFVRFVHDALVQFLQAYSYADAFLRHELDRG